MRLLLVRFEVRALSEAVNLLGGSGKRIWVDSPSYSDMIGSNHYMVHGVIDAVDLVALKKHIASKIYYLEVEATQ